MSGSRRNGRSSEIPLLPLRGATAHTKVASRPSLKITGLFAGIGGIELGMHGAGHETIALCEIDPAARTVLAARFEGVKIHGDITTMRGLPRGTEVVAAGFPCQDLSQAGMTKGIGGARSGLITTVFELLAS